MPINNSPHDFFIQWHLTENCNLRCSHCYQTGTGSTEMSLEEIEAAIDEITEMLQDWSRQYGVSFSPGFNITGGEPFLRKDLFDILSRIREKGFEIFILSNGTLINKKMADRLIALGVKGVQVSIEGPEAVHDRIRGMGSFSASLDGVQNLLEAGMEVTLNTTLSDRNADSFMDMIDIAASLRVQRLGFSRLVPSGRGAALLKSMLPTEKVKQLYSDIFSRDIDGLTIVTGDPLASQMRSPSTGADGGVFPTGGCAAGISGITLLPDGTVLPCRRLPIPLGNIREDSLRELWATSEILNILRDRSRYAGKCGRCSRWSVCRGCRAIAHAYSRTEDSSGLVAEDPQCFL